MSSIGRVVAIALIALPSLPLSAQTLEQRVRELERRLDSVIRAQSPPPPITVSMAGNTGAAAALAPDVSGNVHLRWGSPGGTCRLLPKEFFVICHDGQRRVPFWVGYHVTRADLAANVAERSSGYTPDPDLDAGERAEDANYDFSGYDRGHMAPAADFRRSAEAMTSTFLLSNMAPQRPRLNRGIWRSLEGRVRDLASAHGSVWIFTGPVFSQVVQAPLQGRVTVPSHFYKVVLCQHATGTNEMFAYMLPNQEATIPSARLDEFAVSVDEVERVSGLDFFSQLPAAEERRLEARVATLPRP